MTAVSASRWPRLRRAIRLLRIGGLLVVLMLVCALVYLNVAGLPEPVQRALRVELAARGLDFDSETLRLNWNWGILAERVRVRGTSAQREPALALEELVVRLNWRAAWQGRIEVMSVIFRDGRLTTNLAPTNEPPDLLIVENLGGVLRFLPGDRWELDSFRGSFLGASLSAFGSITNASQLPRLLGTDRPAPTTTNAPAGPDWTTRARPLLHAWRQLKFVAPPELRARVAGDAATPESFAAEMRLTTAGVVSPWGNCAGFDLTLALNHRRPDGAPALRGTLKADALETPWGAADDARLEVRVGEPAVGSAPRWLELELTARELRPAELRLARVVLEARAEPHPDDRDLWQTRFELRSGPVAAPGSAADATHFRGAFTHDFPKWRPLAGEGELTLTRPSTPAGHAAAARLATTVQRASTPAPDLPDLPAWLAAWRGRVAATVDDVVIGEQSVRSLRAEADWGAPQLTVTNTVAEFAQTTVTLDATADARTREVAVRAAARGQALTTLRPWLPAAARNRLTEVLLEDPVALECAARVRLPAPLSLAALGSAEFRRSLTGEARLRLGRADWRRVTCEAGELSARFAEDRITLESLVLRRPEGALTLAGHLDLATLEFGGAVEIRWLPEALAPAFGTRRPRVFSVFAFRQPPAVEAHFAGRGAALETLSASGTVTGGDFAVRGQDLRDLTATVVLTNGLIAARDIAVFHAEQRAGADGLGFDLRTHRLSLTNATAEMEPMVVATAIGTNVVRAIDDYRFLQPPRARVNGSLITRGRTNHADLRFELAGGPFEYWRFRVPQLAGTVVWREETVTVTNLLADFYGGRLDLDLQANLLPGNRARIGFDARFADADLRRSIADLVPGTTNLDGTISGRLTVRELLTDDWKSWQGGGEVRLRDGYLWDLPLAAFLSEAVNSIMPGVGKTRASAGTCTFGMTNSVLHTRDLRIEARPLRLAGRGNVDFDANVNMDFEAEILPGIPLVGPLFNLAILPVSKAFTYRVTGTLGNPRVQPLYVPKFLSTLLNLGRQPTVAKPGPGEPPPP